MPFYEFEGLRPVVHPTAFIHPDAVLIGDVIVGPGVYVAPLASLRGDYGRLIIGRGANVQDCCIMHGYAGVDTVVEDDGHIGHGVILHGCVIGRDALVGMHSVVMDGASIGAESIVAAMSFVKAGFRGEPRQLLMGSPATVRREVSDEDLQWKRLNTQEYQDLARRSTQTMRPCVPLSEIEPNRPYLRGTTDVGPSPKGKAKTPKSDVSRKKHR